MKIDEILSELANSQRRNVPLNKRLQYTDLKRIAKYLNNSLFDKEKCCIWNGYITNTSNVSKGIYINFYFRGKKNALHRLLYINYVDDLKPDEYIKYSCNNKGKCCNINHLVKYKYIDNAYAQKKNIKSVDNIKNEDEIMPDDNNNINDFIVIF